MSAAVGGAGRLVVVTGAARGLGRAIARAFAAEGARVVLADRDADGCAAASAALRDEGVQALGIAADVGDEASVAQLFERAAAWGGAPEVLVNNAGITVQKPALELSLAEWRAVQDVNLAGSFLCAREFARSALAAGLASASIVNVASINGLVAPAFHPSSAYAAAKAGVVGLTRALAVEWAGHGIRVNAVAPTYLRTEMTAQRLADPAYASRIVERTPLGRIAEPEDIAGAVLFLASRASAMVTGQVIAVDGGWTIV